MANGRDGVLFVKHGGLGDTVVKERASAHLVRPRLGY
jgi:hypothetical protein